MIARMGLLLMGLLYVMGCKGSDPQTPPVDASRPTDASPPPIDTAPLVIDAAVTDVGPDAAGSDATSGGFKIVAGQATIELDDSTPAKRKPLKRPRESKKTAKSKKTTTTKTAALSAQNKTTKTETAKTEEVKNEAKSEAKKRAPTALGTIRRNMRDVEHCYGRVALKDPTIKGRIVVQWTIGQSGKPTAVAIVKNTLKDKSVGQCIRKRAKKWTFPPPKGGVSVITYPFNLKVQ